jgi:hypothetical protein
METLISVLFQLYLKSTIQIAYDNINNIFDLFYKL